MILKFTPVPTRCEAKLCRSTCQPMRRNPAFVQLICHDLRHICGSNLMIKGGLAVMPAVLGHRDIGTTVDVYRLLAAVHLAESHGGDFREDEDS